MVLGTSNLFPKMLNYGSARARFPLPDFLSNTHIKGLCRWSTVCSSDACFRVVPGTAPILLRQINRGGKKKSSNQQIVQADISQVPGNWALYLPPFQERNTFKREIPDRVQHKDTLLSLGAVGAKNRIVLFK